MKCRAADSSCVRRSPEEAVGCIGEGDSPVAPCFISAGQCVTPLIEGAPRQNDSLHTRESDLSCDEIRDVRAA